MVAMLRRQCQAQGLCAEFLPSIPSDGLRAFFRAHSVMWDKVLRGAFIAPSWSLYSSLQTHPPAFCYTQIYSLVVFTLHQLEGERKGIFLYMNCLGDFLQLLWRICLLHILGLGFYRHMAENTILQKAKEFDWWKTREQSKRNPARGGAWTWNLLLKPDFCLRLKHHTILALTAVWLCTDARRCFLDLTKSGA